MFYNNCIRWTFAKTFFPCSLFILWVTLSEAAKNNSFNFTNKAHFRRINGKFPSEIATRNKTRPTIALFWRDNFYCNYFEIVNRRKCLRLGQICFDFLYMLNFFIFILLTAVPSIKISFSFKDWDIKSDFDDFSKEATCEIFILLSLSYFPFARHSSSKQIQKFCRQSKKI